MSDLSMSDYAANLSTVHTLFSKVRYLHNLHANDEQVSTLASNEPMYQRFKEKYKDNSAFLACNGSLDGYDDAKKNLMELAKMRETLRVKCVDMAKDIMEGLEKFQREFEEVKKRLHVVSTPTTV
ncbi:Nn.00g117800.m01.CDS01 [Neocucurbitaria sp. VM-36]